MAISVQKIANVVAGASLIGTAARAATVAAVVVTIDTEIIIDVDKIEAITVNETLNQQHHYMVGLEFI